MQHTRRSSSIHRMIAMALVPIVCLTLCTCAQNPERNGPTANGSPVEDFVASIFYYDYDDVYISSVRNALTADLASKQITYQEYDADHDQITQNSQIDKAIAEDASILIVNIVNSGSAERTDVICQKASSANIPLIFFNRPIEEDGYEGVILNYYDNVAFVGTDSAEAGHLQGEMIGEYLTQHYDEVDLNGDGRISYAMFKGEAANAEAIYRTIYSVEDANAILKSAGYPDLVYFDPASVDKFQLDLTGSWTKESVVSYMTTNLVHYNEEKDNMIELVIANSDAMAEGAIEALQTFGYNLGTPGSTTIPVFGVDASAAGRELIAKGIMTGTIAQDAQAMADCIAQMVENAKNGKDLLDGMDSYPRDTEFGRDRMIILPYSIYSPQEGSIPDNSTNK
ncbi:MAG: galactose ABC transporter substrate-binding protein [Coriobacteriales bacterium]|nr:galactose ABC transporter substrate-binding protein [Coriobacteriales bacterium]